MSIRTSSDVSDLDSTTIPQRLYSQLQSSGVVSELQSQIRTHVLRALKFPQDSARNAAKKGMYLV